MKRRDGLLPSYTLALLEKPYTIIKREIEKCMDIKEGEWSLERLKN